MTIQLPLQNPIAVTAHSRRLNSGEQRMDRAERALGAMAALLNQHKCMQQTIEIHT